MTIIASDESRELFIKHVEVPTQFVSGLFHNILVLRRVETSDECIETSIAVLKTRDSGHDSRLWDFDIGDDGMFMRAPRASDRGKPTLGGGRGAKSNANGRPYGDSKVAML